VGRAGRGRGADAEIRTGKGCCKQGSGGFDPDGSRAGKKEMGGDAEGRGGRVSSKSEKGKGRKAGERQVAKEPVVARRRQRRNWWAGERARWSRGERR
jgi:hypothetical protein